MVKKLICMLLVLTCAFALFACGEEEPPVNNDNNNGNQNQNPPEVVLPDAEFFELIENSEPNRITTVTATTDLKDSAETVYNGLYDTVINADGSYKFDYSYEIMRSASLDNVGESSKELISGSILAANGLYSVDGGETWSGSMPDVNVINVKLDLNREYIDGYKLSKDGKTLTVNVSAENAEKILGVKIVTNEDHKDVTIKVESNGTYLSKITVSYENDNVKASIITSYTYEAVLETPAE